MCHRTPWAPLVLLLAACGGGPVVQSGDGGDPGPGSLRVFGLVDGVLDLGEVPLGEVVTVPLELRNPGPGGVELRGFELGGPGLRWASPPPIGWLAPGASATLVVAYEARRDESAVGALRWHSTAPGQEDIEVEVRAEGLGPRLELPTSLKLGTSSVGCTAGGAIPLRNAGRQPLNLLSVSLAGASLIGPVPEVLEPGASASFIVSALPSEPGRSEAALTVRSDDPERSVATTALSWTATLDGLPHHTAEQAGDGQVDYLFLLPASSGAELLQERLAAVLPRLVSRLDDAGVAWRAAVVPGLPGGVPAEVVTEAGEEGAADRLVAGTQLGSDAEGVWLAEAARRFLQAGSGFRRDRAGLRVVLVSPGIDDSLGLYEAADIAAWFAQQGVGATDVEVFLVAPASVCGGMAPSPLLGALAPAGHTYDACLADWGGLESALVGAGEHRAAHFGLPEVPPDPARVWVDVDGAPTLDFTLDGAWLRFDEGAVPANGQVVGVRWLDEQSCG